MNLIKQGMLETHKVYEVYNAFTLSVILIYNNCYSVIYNWFHTFDIKACELYDLVAGKTTDKM